MKTQELNLFNKIKERFSEQEAYSFIEYFKEIITEKTINNSIINLENKINNLETKIEIIEKNNKKLLWTIIVILQIINIILITFYLKH